MFSLTSDVFLRPFCASAPPEADAVVAKHLEVIISTLRKRIPQFRSVYLAGSFGRGEGTVDWVDGRWQVVNDYDIIVVSDEWLPDDLAKVRQLTEELSEMLQIDYVDICPLRLRALAELPLTIENYDFKFAARLLCGEEVRVQIPDYSSSGIKPYELLRLICNRSAGLLTAELPDCQSDNYGRNQHIKAVIAVGDLIVYLQDKYQCSYAARMDKLTHLVNEKCLPFPLSDVEFHYLTAAYERKLNLLKEPFMVQSEVTRKLIHSAYVALAYRCTDVKSRSFREAEASLIYYYFADNQMLRSILRICWRSAIPSKRQSRLRQYSQLRVLLAQPHFYLLSNAARTKQMWHYLFYFFWIPMALRLPWNSVSAVRLWLSYCH